jgi:hypothetical protein
MGETQAQLVILNDFERPEASCIAVVRDGMWAYVSTRKSKSGYAGWTKVQRPQDHTPIETFGVRATLVNAPIFDRLVVSQVAPSRATYSDGLARAWQAELPDGTGVRPEMRESVRAALASVSPQAVSENGNVQGGSET